MTDWLKRIGWGCGVGCALWGVSCLSITIPERTAYSQQSLSGGNANQDGLFHLHTTLLPTGIEQIVVVDSQARSMAVYHIEPATAKIQLKSVRNLVWDLQMEHFNGQAPLPSELRQVQP